MNNSTASQSMWLVSHDASFQLWAQTCPVLNSSDNGMLGSQIRPDYAESVTPDAPATSEVLGRTAREHGEGERRPVGVGRGVFGVFSKAFWNTLVLEGRRSTKL